MLTVSDLVGEGTSERVDDDALRRNTDVLLRIACESPYGEQSGRIDALIAHRGAVESGGPRASGDEVVRVDELVLALAVPALEVGVLIADVGDDRVALLLDVGPHA